MKPGLQLLSGRVARVLAAATLVAALPTLVRAQGVGVTQLLVLQDNGYDSGSFTLPQDPFYMNIIRDVDVAWIRVWTMPTSSPVALTSSDPSIFAIEPNHSPNIARVTIKEPGVPTKVTVTANTIPPTFGKVFNVTVLPRQRVESAKLVPQKPFYSVGEEVEVEVTMRYAEPFASSDRSFRQLLLEFEPYDLNEPTAYVQTKPTWGSQVEQRGHMGFPLSKVFRFTMRLLRPEPAQTLNLSVKCSYSRVEQYGSMQYDECHTGIVSLQYSVIGEPQLDQLVLDNATIVAGTSTRGRIDVSSMATDASAVVMLTSSDPSVTVPTSVALQSPTSGGHATATFPIQTTMTTGSRTATIRATLGPQEKSAVLSVEGVAVRDLTVSRPELIAQESFDLVITLDRPAPGPILVQLVSSDPRTVPVPTQLQFNKGEQSKRVSVRTGATMSFADVRVGGSISGSPVSREALVRVRPADAVPTSGDRSRTLLPDSR